MYMNNVTKLPVPANAKPSLSLDVETIIRINDELAGLLIDKDGADIDRATLHGGFYVSIAQGEFQGVEVTRSVRFPQRKRGKRVTNPMQAAA